jgi:preprotein translocase subunit SecG
MGAAFGSGASGSLFGASGSANFLSRSTAVIATVFFVATIGLAYSSNSVRAARGGGLMSSPGPAPTAPAESSAPGAAVPQQTPPSAAPAAPGVGDSTAKPAPAAPAEKSAAIPK